jgi:hypothetical protein
VFLERRRIEKCDHARHHGQRISVYARHVKRGIVVVVALVIGVVVWMVLRRGGDADETQPAAPVTGSGSAPALTAGGRSLRSPDAPPPAWFAKAGVKDRKIAGRVTFEGKPVRARVALHSLLTTAGIQAPVVKDTGEDGAFDFGSRPGAMYQVVASADNLVAAIARIDLTDPTAKPAPDKLELVLRACNVAIVGTVFDNSGGPIAGARVRREGLVGTETTDKGTYRLCVPRGEVELEYSADGYGAVIIGLSANGEIEQNIVLVPEGIVTATVIRASDGKPVEDALVNVNPKEWGRDRRANRFGITGADGKVRISGLTPGGYMVWGSARGLIPETGVEVIVEVGAFPEVTVKLYDTARISGRVMQGDKPIAGATVLALRKSPVRRSSPAVSQEDGSFVLDEVPVGDLIFTAHPYKVKAPAGLPVEAKPYDNVVIEVEPLGKVHGIVTRLGKPLPGAEVCCLNGAAGRRTATSGGDGSYEFVGVEPGPHELLAGLHDDAFVLPTKFTLGAGETKRLDFDLNQAGTIAGTVVDKTGKPVPGVFVLWIHEKTGDAGRGTTDAQGRFRCGAMTGGGVYRASVRASMLSQQPFRTADGGPYPSLLVKDGTAVIDNVEIKIDYQKLSITGRVVDANNAGVADAQVRGTLTSGEQPGVFNTWQKLPSTFSDAEGTFTLDELTVGTYALQARSAEGGEGVLANIAAGATGATIKLLRAAGVEGKLVGYTAPPAVYAVPLQGGDRWTAGTVDGQTFRVRGLSPGRYLVSAQTTYDGDGKVVTVESGKVTPLTLTSRGRAVIEATVLDFRTTAPIPGAACHVLVASDGMFGVTNWDFATAPKSDASGRVLLDPSPAGQITVECGLASPRWSMPSADVTVAAGGRANVTLYGVEQSNENPSDPGVEFDRHVTTPVVARVKGNAAKAGVLPGDLVVSVDGVSVTKLDRSGVYALLLSHDGGSEIALGVTRGGTPKTFKWQATQ